MSQEELRRVEVLARVRSNQRRVVDASRLMRVSYRQAKRLWKRYREEGPAGLKHRGAGRASNRAYPPKFRQRVLDLVREKYGGAVGERFGPTLAVEHLGAEDGLPVNAETLRLWMLEAGLWSRERKRRKHRRRRERKEHFGELVQMDGSFHPWLEERGPEGCLIDMADDATNTTWAQLGEQETIWAAADALRAWIEKYGVPLALYVDWKNPVQAAGHAGRAVTGRRADHAVWAHVRETRNRDHCCEFGPSEGADRANSRHASGPAREEIAAERNPHAPGRQRVSGAGVSARRWLCPALRPKTLRPSGSAGLRSGPRQRTRKTDARYLDRDGNRRS